METVKEFTNDKDRVFNAVVSEDKHYDGGLIVSFYDAKSANKEEKFGQFTGGRYYIDTLLGLDGWSEGIRGKGLCFDGGNADSWSIDDDTSTQVFLWLSEIRENKERIKQFKEDDEKILKNINKLLDAWKEDELDKSQLEKSK